MDVPPSPAPLTRTPPSLAKRPPTWAWAALLLALVAVYLANLDSLSLPSNGDEMVYSHIARRTAESGHWLPLVSDMPQMRNTKPPLLFWQAMVAGQWGDAWELGRLRLPAVLHTLALVAGLVWLVTCLERAMPPRQRDDATRTGLPGSPATPSRLAIAPPPKLSPDPQPDPHTALTSGLTTGLMAGVFYLAFFSTLRYGRPYLTSAFETLWLCAPPAWLLWRWGQGQPTRPDHRDRAPDLPPWRWWLASGLLWGVGLWFKSFALIAPAAAALGLMACVLHPPQLRHGTQTNLPLAGWVAWLARIAVRVGFSAVVALAVFALWFALDPDPAAVWREFVVGENAGKLASSAQPWHRTLLAMLVQALAPAENAGLLAMPVLAAAVVGWRGVWRRWRAARLDNPARTRRPVEPTNGRDPRRAVTWALLAWVLVWVLTFCLPSQRSARYIIPAMPAVAWLLALHAPRIPRWAWAMGAALALPVLALLGRLLQAQVQLGIAAPEMLWAGGAVAALTSVALIGAWRHAGWSAWGNAAAALGVYALLALVLAPLTDAGRFALDTRALPAGARMALPSGFNQQHERYRFLLPAAIWRDGAVAVPYANAPDQLNPARLAELLASHDAVVWATPSAEVAPACAATPAPTCRVLAQRWDVRTRHRPGEITAANLWQPAQWAYAREWLLTSSP